MASRKALTKAVTPLRAATQITVKPGADAADNEGLHASASHDDDGDGDPTAPREPFKFVKLIAKYPRLSFAISLSMHVAFLAVSGVLVLNGYDLFPFNFETMPLELYNEPWLKREYAWKDRDQYPNRVDRSLPPNKFPSWDRAFTRDAMLLIYSAGDDNIFTKERLQAMLTIEQRLANVTQFSSYCQMTQGGTCAPFLSVLRFFDGTYSSVDLVFSDPNFNNIDSVLYAAYTHNETKSAFVYALGKTNKISKSSVSSTLIRTLIPFGWPLRDYEDEDAMETALTDFMVQRMSPVLESSLDSSPFDFFYYNELLVQHDAFQLAFHDMALAVGSLIFIFLFIWFHTRSLWVTTLSVLSIASSFVETNLIYRMVIGFKYFGFFHIIAMFIILGIGADDLFVFWDAWQATGLRQHPSLAHRLNEAYRKSVISMLVTSLTTMVAFVSSAVSPLLATMSFGCFAAIMVVINYLSVVIFFPTIITIYHLYFESKSFPCCCRCRKKRVRNGEVEDSVSSEHSNPVCTSSEDSKPITKSSANGLKNNPDPVSNNKRSSLVPKATTPIRRFSSASPAVSASSSSQTLYSGSDESSERLGGLPRKPSKLVIFFRDYYFALVTHRIVRWVILALLLGCLAGLAYSASNLKPDNEQMQVYRDSHHYSKAIKHLNYDFDVSDHDPTITIHLVWGLKENDLSDCHFSSVGCKGEHDYDDSFDASTTAAQQSFVAICDTLFNFTDEQVSEYAIKRNIVSGQMEIACFPRNMEAFLKNDPVSGAVDVSLPWDWNKTSDFMTSLSSHYNTTSINSSFGQYLDIPLTYWVWDGFDQNNTADYQMFNSLFGEETDTYSSSILTNPSITTGNRIKYMAIAVNTTLYMRSMGYDEGIPIVERWERFMKDQLQKMPEEMQSGFQTTVFSWHWLYVQRTLAENAILGIGLGVLLAFPVLVIATCNVFNGLLATFCICCVTTCVIGIIPLGGWKLGVLVSLNMCLVVGLAVDFVVHLAEGYHMSHHRDRKGRLQEALERMGISVFSGACTTLGASTFALFAQIQFSFQFGIFMFCTIGFSLLFSMGFYVTIMGILGPEGDVGDIRVFFKKCCARCRSRKHRRNNEASVRIGPRLPSQPAPEKY